MSSTPMKFSLVYTQILMERAVPGSVSIMTLFNGAMMLVGGRVCCDTLLVLVRIASL
jgi:hypothetical protein